jgi:hypothetical protein
MTDTHTFGRQNAFFSYSFNDFSPENLRIIPVSFREAEFLEIPVIF